MFLLKLFCFLLGQVKTWLASFFQRFYGWEGGVFFDSEVLMLKYNKTYNKVFTVIIVSQSSGKPYHLHVHKHHIGMQIWSVFGQLI